MCISSGGERTQYRLFFNVCTCGLGRSQYRRRRALSPVHSTPGMQLSAAYIRRSREGSSSCPRHIADYCIIARRTARVCVRSCRILVLTIRRIERDTPDYVPSLQPNPSVDGQIFQHGFSDQNLPRTSRPSPIPSIPGVLTEAEVEAVALNRGSRQLSVPLVTPSVAMIVTGEESHEPGGGSHSLHKWDVLSAVHTGGIIGAISTPALRLLSQWIIVVDARLMI